MSAAANTFEDSICVATQSGKLECWWVTSGWGMRSESYPPLPSDLGHVVKVAHNKGTMCTINNMGGLKCFGDNSLQYGRTSGGTFSWLSQGNLAMSLTKGCII